MNKISKNVLIIGPEDSNTNVDLTNSIFKTCEILYELNMNVYLITEKHFSILNKCNEGIKLIIDEVTTKTVTDIINDKKIDIVIPTLGDRNSLNIITQNDFPKNVDVVGPSKIASLSTFNRDIFSSNLKRNKLPVIEYISSKNEEEVYDFVRKNDFPLILRRRYKNKLSTGWTNVETLYDLNNFIDHDPDFNDTVEIERSIKGLREFSITTLRDVNGNTNMIGVIEDIQPIGIHHLDSLLLTPAITLTNTQIQELRNAAIKVSEVFNITGVCTTHFALNTEKNEFYITEIIPRLSEETRFLQSSYNYPIPEIAIQLNLGYSIDKLIDVNGNKLNAAFEPNIDHLCMRVPTWRNIQEIPISTKKSSNGAFFMRGNSLEELFKKGPLNRKITQTSTLTNSSFTSLNDDEIFEKIIHPTNRQITVLQNALNRGFDISSLTDITKIHPVYLRTLKELSKIKYSLIHNKADIETLEKGLCSGFSISEISRYWQMNDAQLLKLIQEFDIQFQLNETSFPTDKVGSSEYIPSLGIYNEFHQDENLPVIIIRAMPEKSVMTRVKNNYLISRLSQASHLNGYGTIIVDRAARNVLSLDKTVINRVIDTYDELLPFNLIDHKIIKYEINLGSSLSDKNGLLDEGETKIFEDSSIKGNDSYEFLILNNHGEWFIDSYIAKERDSGEKFVRSNAIESKKLYDVINNFINHVLSESQRNLSKLLNFSIIQINDDIYIKKVSIGFSDNIIMFDNVSPINLMDTYIKILSGLSFKEMNIEVNEYGFLKEFKPIEIILED